MVNLVEDWPVLEEYAGGKLGFYQLRSTYHCYRKPKRLEASKAKNPRIMGISPKIQEIV